jgi:glycine cleavage system H protein
VATIEGREYPEHLHYDVDNQIWYELLGDGTLKVGFTPWAVALMGDVLVFTPKRLGRDFEPDRSFAVVEGGKWVGSARAAFAGIVIAHNEALMRRPEMLNEDPFGTGWMLVARPSDDDWRRRLVTGAAIAGAFSAWIASGAYESRA